MVFYPATDLIEIYQDILVLWLRGLCWHFLFR